VGFLGDFRTETEKKKPVCEKVKEEGKKPTTGTVFIREGGRCKKQKTKGVDLPNRFEVKDVDRCR